MPKQLLNNSKPKFKKSKKRLFWPQKLTNHGYQFWQKCRFLVVLVKNNVDLSQPSKMSIDENTDFSIDTIPEQLNRELYRISNKRTNCISHV